MVRFVSPHGISSLNWNFNNFDLTVVVTTSWHFQSPHSLQFSEDIQNNVNRLTQEQGWNRQELAGGKTVLDMILNQNLPEERLDDQLWSLLTD